MGTRVTLFAECPGVPKKLKHSQLVTGIVYTCDGSSTRRYVKIDGIVYCVHNNGVIDRSICDDTSGAIFTESDDTICIQIGKKINR